MRGVAGSRRWGAALAALALATPHSATVAQSPRPAPAAPAASPDRRVPEFAPDFSRADLAGRPVRLGAYRGKLVLLSFWATWCEPCRSEAPRFSAWQREYGPRGLQVLGISMDDDVAAATEFARALQLAYPVVMGDARLAELFGGVLGLPLTFLIDPSGRIVARYRGEPDLDRVESELRAALPARPR